MDFTDITDINLPELKIYHQLRDNAFTEDNSFIADSPKVVNLLLQTDIIVKSILATKEFYDTYIHLLKDKNISKLFIADKALMEEIVGHTLHHNVMMHAIRPEPTSLDSLGKHIIMLDEISSTQNIGAIATGKV